MTLQQFQDIVPFDATRVALEKPVCVEGETEASDFINASYISDISAGLNPIKKLFPSLNPIKTDSQFQSYEKLFSSLKPIKTDSKLQSFKTSL